MQIMTISRERLFELVWTKPISQLAAEYALSDVGLAKVCARHGIPTPPRGYWARVAAGQAPKRPRLPSATRASRIEMRIAQPLQNEEGGDELRAALDENARPDRRIVVPDRLATPCALVRAARDMLHGATTDEVGFLEPPNGCLALRVSKRLLPRALRVADALVQELGARGWATTVDAASGATYVAVRPADIALSFSEQIDVVDLPVEA